MSSSGGIRLLARSRQPDNEGKKVINPILFNFANDYLRDKPQVATLMAQIDRKL